MLTDTIPRILLTDLKGHARKMALSKVQEIFMLLEKLPNAGFFHPPPWRGLRLSEL